MSTVKRDVRSSVRAVRTSDHADVRRLLSAPLVELYPGGLAWLDRRLAEIDVAGRVSAAGLGGRLDAVTLETWKPDGRIKLSTFFVAPFSRGAGLGTALASELVRTWTEEGRESVYVTVAEQAAPALLRVLGPLGFMTVAVERDRYGPGRDEHVLVWEGAHLARLSGNG